MTKKEIADALEEVRYQSEIVEKMKQENPEDVPAFWAEVLAEKGCNVSSDEIASFIREAEEERRKKTQENAGKIDEVPDEMLGEVAGGGDHPNCFYTYKDRENCWQFDACDMVNMIYAGYICKHVHN